MSEDWETHTVIGRNTRGGGSGSRDTVVRGSNKAAHLKNSGAEISTEKKWATANKAGTASGGQRLTKIDRSDDIIAQKSVLREVKLAVPKGRRERVDKDGNPAPLTQQQLADLCQVSRSVVADVEDLGKTAQPQDYHKFIQAAQRVMGIQLTGDPENIGKPKLTKAQEKALEERKKKEAEERKKAKAEAKRIKEEEEAAAKAKEEEEAAAREKEEAEKAEKEEEVTAAVASLNVEEDEEEKPLAKGKGKGKGKGKANADEEDEDE